MRIHDDIKNRYSDLEIVAMTLFGEAKAGDVDDLHAIACVILNRRFLPNWPFDFTSVCLQLWQFSCWNKKDANRKRITNPDNWLTPWYRKCHEQAVELTHGSMYDITDTATHYHTPGVKPKWSVGKTPCFQTAGHLYFNDIDTPKPLAKVIQAVKDTTLTQKLAVGTAVTATTTSAVTEPEDSTVVIETVTTNAGYFVGLLQGGTYYIAIAAVVGVITGGTLFYLYKRKKRKEL